MTTGEGVLQGLRVVEFAQNVAVPTCGRVLASMGADVVKVEPPHGDATRSMAPFPGTDEGRAYAVTNPGKRSVVLDLTSPDAAAPRDALLASADIVLTAFKGPDLERYGLAYDRVAAINPTVIYLEMRALGSVGPDADEGGYDVLVQGLSGLSFVTSRSENGRPVTVRPAYSDMATGLASTAAVLAALYHRQKTGEGQRVRTSLLGTAYYLGLPMLARFDGHDSETLAEFSEDLSLLRQSGATFDEQRDYYESRVLPAGGAFEIWFRHYLTADSMISIGALSPMLIDRFHAVTGLPDPRRNKWGFHSPEWNALIADAEKLLLSDTTEAWMTRLRAGGVPCSRYNVPTEALDDEGAVANGFVLDLDHPVLGRYRTAATPISMDSTPVRITGPSPILGSHTTEVLSALGFSDADIQKLDADGVTRPATR